MLRQIDMTGPVFNGTDDYYINKSNGETLNLVAQNQKFLTFFNPNNYKTYQCSADEFNVLTAKKKLIKADYVLGCSYIANKEVDITREYVASTNLKDLYEKLVSIAGDPDHSSAVFQACYVKDLNTGDFIVRGNQVAKLQSEIKMLMQETQKFQPSPIDVKKLLTAAGIPYPEPELTKASTKRNGR